MTNESFNKQVRTDIKALVNNEIDVASANGIKSDTLAAVLSSAMLEASVNTIKSIGFSKKDAQYYFKNLLNDLFNDWE